MSKLVIHFNDELIDIKILSQDLIKYHMSRTGQPNIFRARPKKVIKRLANAYNISYKLIQNYNANRTHNGENTPVLVHIEFEELRISETVLARSVSNAWMQIALKIYNSYCNKIYFIND